MTDESRPIEEAARPRALAGRVPALVAIAAAVAFAAAASSLTPLLWQATAAAVVAGAVVFWVALFRPPERLPAPRAIDRRGMLPWLVVLGALGLWELHAFLRGSMPDHPTLSLLADPFFDSRPGRALGYLAWLAGGWWVIRR